MAKTKKRRKLNIRGLLVILLIIYLIGSFLYYIINLPVKNIRIIGTSLVSDVEIIETANLKNYPAIFKINTNKMKKNLKKIDLISDAKIKRSLFGNITINVTEEKILFLNRNKNKLVLGNGKEINVNKKYYGYPILINYVPDAILKEFVAKFKEIDNNIISSIGEIEYSIEKFVDPMTTEEIISNDKRFLLRMNDTNSVYVDTINLKKLNNYYSYYATTKEGVRGVFYLDSNRGAVSFKSYGEIKEESEKLDEDKLQ